MMSVIYIKLKELILSRKLKEVFVWCLPALMVGLALRITLMVHLPYAYYHDDTPDFLCTVEGLLADCKFEVHSKKTFLVPAIFSVPFILGIPALIAIPIFQHTLGVGVILIMGALCRLWFRWWKIFIIPVTLLIAINPFLLWYEHAIMAETTFIFCIMLTALAGTLYTFRQSLTRLSFLLLSLFLTAGARPEGKLFFGFGLFLIVLLHLRNLRTHWPNVAIAFAVALCTHFVTKTSQASLLLYTSVARLTPTELKCAPGFEPYIAPVRSELQARWDTQHGFPRVIHRRQISAAVKTYIKENKDKKITTSVDTLCMKLAVETCIKNFFYLPIHAYHKFRYTSNEAPAGSLDNDWLFVKQREAYEGAFKKIKPLSKGLTGSWLNSDEEIQQFFNSHYGEVPWFQTLLKNWQLIVNKYRFPDSKYTDPEFPKYFLTYYGIPFYFLGGALGLIALFFCKGPLQKFHFAWGLNLLALFYVIILTGNVRPRFRLLFEPFWFLYILLLLECFVILFLCLKQRPSVTKPTVSE